MPFLKVTNFRDQRTIIAAAAIVLVGEHPAGANLSSEQVERSPYIVTTTGQIDLRGSFDEVVRSVEALGITTLRAQNHDGDVVVIVVDQIVAGVEVAEGVDVELSGGQRIRLLIDFEELQALVDGARS